MSTETPPNPEATQTSVTLRREEEGRRVIASVTAGSDPLTIDPAWLQTTLDENGLAGAVIFRAGIQKLQRMLANAEAGEADIGEYRDAEVGLQISDDKLSAKLLIKTAHAGAPATLEHIDELIINAKLHESRVDRDAIQRLLDAASIAKPGAVVQVIIAHGKPAVNGKNSTFQALVEASNRHPAEREDGSLDYLDLGAIPAVNEGEPLMRRHPPTLGVDGITVTGQVIKAKDGRERRFEHGKGSSIDPNDSNLLVATMTGQPVIHANGVSVDPVLRVKDVNLRTGHIDYDGSLVVSGSISPGMRLKVAGDVLVLGMVESSELEIGGNLDVKMGISGQRDESQHDHSPMRVCCQGNLSAGYIENAELEVGGDLTVKSLVTHCQAKVKHQVSVGSAGQPRSGIVGGCIQAEAQIRAQTLGTQAGIATKVEILCSSDTLTELQQTLQLVETRNNDLGKHLKTMVELSKTKGKQPNSQERIDETNKRCDALKKEIVELTAKGEQLRAIVDAIFSNCIGVSGTVYPRVTISIGDFSREITKPTDHVSFCRTDEALEQRPYIQPAKKAPH